LRKAPPTNLGKPQPESPPPKMGPKNEGRTKKGKKTKEGGKNSSPREKNNISPRNPFLWERMKVKA